MVLITSSFEAEKYVLISGRASVSAQACAPLSVHDCQRSCLGVCISVRFNDLLMDDCLSSARGLSGPLQCPAVPMSKVSLQTFSFLIIPQPLSIYFKSSRPHMPPPQPQRCFQSSRRINVLKRKGSERRADRLVLPERDLHGGHKSRGERRGGRCHIRGSVCVEVN